MCTLCNVTGQFDDDRDPSTPCSDTNICMQVCAAGFEDADCDDATECTRCASGEYTAGGNGTDALCAQCSAGSADHDNDASTPCTTCAAGFAAAEGHDGQCDECREGEYAPEGAASCVECAAGFADEDSQSSTECIECLAGLYAESGHSGSCISCPGGRFAPAAGGTALSTCDSCQLGQYSSSGSSSCAFCSSGQADADGNASTPCTECAAGTYAGCGATSCDACIAGQIDSDGSAATPCTSCLSGQYWAPPSGGAPVCSELSCGSPFQSQGNGLCANDPYCAQLSETHQVGCCSDAEPIGQRGYPEQPPHFGWRSPTGACVVWGVRHAGNTACTWKTYAEATAHCAELGARLCTAEELAAGCVAGTGCGGDYELHWSSSILTSSCIQCEAGHADLDSDSTTACESCTVGGYAAPGSSACTSCLSQGQFDHDDDPSTPCSDTDICLQVCVAGTQDDDCDEATACVVCSAGKYAAGGVFPGSRCLPCVNGTADDDSNPATECVRCLAGFYAEAGHSGDCISCPSGRFAPTAGGTGSSACQHCQSGQFSASGFSSCAFCSAGTADADDNAATPCIHCAVGTYAGCGETSCVACVAGQIDGDENAATPCTSCLVGQYWAPLFADDVAAAAMCSQLRCGRATSASCPDQYCAPLLETHQAGCCSDFDPTESGLTRPADWRSPEGSCSVWGTRHGGLGCNASDSLTYVEAEAHCQSLGARLCTAAELDADCVIERGCNDDHRLHWSLVAGRVPGGSCIQCEAGRADLDSDSRSACDGCSVGEYAAPGSSACTSCLSQGQFDDDNDPSTPCSDTHICLQECAAGTQDDDCDEATVCVRCSNGTYAEGGRFPESRCQTCAAGLTDDDSNPATACAQCLAGFYAEEGHSGDCISCPSGRFAPTAGGTALSACDMCQSGQYSSSGSSSCAFCSSGRADEDLDALTECTECSIGTYAGCGETSCDECVAGQIDSDENAATPCTACDAGKYWEAGSGDAMSACVQCEAGRADLDSDSTTACESCTVGGYAAPGSSACTSCLSQGQFDDDRDPSTPCSDTDICLQVCVAGTQDDDCDEATACVVCSAGKYAAGGVFPGSRCLPCVNGTADDDSNPATECVRCLAGFYAEAGHSGDCISCPSGRFAPTAGGTALSVCDTCQSGQYSSLGSSSCAFCSSGRADEDLDASTECTVCSIGTYAGCGETSCGECVAGQIDSDENAATPCTACDAGKYWEAGSALNISSCVQCEAGRADLDSDSTTGCIVCAAGGYAATGSLECMRCVPGQYDDDAAASTACITCPPGTVWSAAASGGSISSCAQCNAGQADLDSDSTTNCTGCPIGTFAGVGSSTCTSCSDTNQFDDDRDPATPCVDTNICVQTCVAGYHDEDCDDATPCSQCSPGEYSAGGTGALCTQCGPGSTDDDDDTSTPCNTCVAGFAAAAGHFGPCEACLVGQYAPAAAPVCTNCTAGSTDNDHDPTTACTQCLAGYYAEAGHSGDCIGCPSGRFAPTAGGTALSVCEMCQSGQYSSSGSSSCAFCSSGRADEDLDASTECTECSSGTYAGCGETSCDECAAGQIDGDGSAATPCTACDAGKYWEAGSGDAISTCIECGAGRADLDSDSTTACNGCAVGEYAAPGSSTCTSCLSQGQFDDDRDPTTPCSDTDICLQVCGAGTQDDDCDENSACVQCELGTYAVGDAAFPASRCEACAAGTSDSDSDPATACAQCSAGFYAEAGHSGDCIGCPSGRFAPTAGGTALTACNMCQSGQYSATASSSCESCTAGRADNDTDASTPCTDCAVGTYAGCGATSCVACVAGQTDSDENAATPCTTCDPGKYWVAGSGGAISSCIQCPAGRVDLDSDSTTPCENCTVGTFCPVGSSEAINCAARGERDDDRDPRTMCRAPSGQTVQASVEMTGSIGDLLSNATAQAQFERDFIRDMAAIAGVDLSRIRVTGVEAAVDSGRRRLQQAGGGVVVSFDIAPALDGSSLPISSLESALVDDIYGYVVIGGLQATEGLGDFSTQNITCTQSCAAGTEDHDCDEATACVACEPGQYTQGGKSPMGRCAYCDEGFADTDDDATTRCVLCAAGSYTESVGHAGACLQCAAGKFSTAPEGERTSAETCRNCATNRYSDEGSSACQISDEFFTCPDDKRQISNFDLHEELCRPNGEWVNQSVLPSQCYGCSCTSEHYDASSFEINCWNFDKKELPEDDLLNDLSVRDIHAHLFEGEEKTEWKSTCIRCPDCVDCSKGSSWEQITIKEGYGLASKGIGE
eukprot:COSAG06_NODE_2347_length_7032_cov_6.408193_2_plen_2258_part_01